VRSRYAAFARKDVDYLWRTLDAAHEDRKREPDTYARAVRGSPLRYMGLLLLDSAPPDGAGLAQVLFLARVFRQGRDLSFIELSDFRHDGVGWRYLGGITKPAVAIQGDPARLTIATFTPGE
jgi:SEC-C motif-containing protein